MTTCMSPDINVSTIAYVASSCTGDRSEANSATRRDMIAVGPSVMSLDVPKKQYKKPPTKAE